jgi:16S rRNA (cytosine1402-N4)-methyltransferase
MTTDVSHQSVLLQESIDGLAVKANGIYVDATFGRGGHSRAILNALGEHGRLIAIDRDPSAIESAKQFANDPRFSIHHYCFSELDIPLKELNLWQKVDGVLMDLGVSSPQLDNSQRGFSFMHDGPLDMRMDPSQGISAAQWLNKAGLEEITGVIKQYGEEKFGRRIATAIVESRKETPLQTTHQLVELIKLAIPFQDPNKHPATRAFQGIRIFINDEFGEIKTGLDKALSCLSTEGRLSVISFHSLEDRIVKRFMKDQSKGEQFAPRLPIPDAQIQASKTLKLVGKAQKPSAEEVAYNPRARSSILRVAEKR